MQAAFPILVILAFLQISPPPSKGNDQQQPTSNKQQNTQQAQPQIVITVFENQDKPAKSQNSSTPQAQQRPEKPPWWDVAWSTLGLAIVAVFGTVAAICTLLTIRNQTKALINSERAWIFADIEPSPGNANRFFGDNVTDIKIRVNCKNVGRSPAWITQIQARFVIAETLPDTPQFDVAEIIHAEPQPMAPGGQPFVTKDKTLTAKGIQGIFETAMVYGIVLYRDTFAENLSTTFGYRLIPGTDLRLERLTGYPKYNENT